MDQRVERQNLAHLASGLRDAADTLQRAMGPSMAAVVETEVFVSPRLEALMQQVVSQQKELVLRLDKLDARLDTMECRVKASDANAIGRLYNSRATHKRDDLFTLLSVRTGHDVRAFPRTVEEVLELPVREVDRILKELGGFAEGQTSAQRRRRLLIGLGIDPDEVF